MKSVAEVVVKTPTQIDYEDEEEKASSKLQVDFGEELAKGRYGRPTAYKKVSVLTLSWDNEHDDLKVQEEVQSLCKVFQERFNFHVTSKSIQCPLRKDVQVYVNHVVSEWVNENDDPENLLIVYYAGHGKPEGSNSLVMFKYVSFQSICP